MATGQPSLLTLRAFEAVARHQSVKLAAEELGVTPAALSQQVRKLEEQLALTLLVRGNRAVSTTAAGAELSAELTRAFSRLKRAVHRVDGACASRPLVLATIPSFSARWLAPRLGGYTRAHPELPLSINARVHFSESEADGFDVAIDLMASPPEGFAAEFFMSESVLPLASPAYVDRQGLREPRDLLRCDLLHDNSLAAIDGSTPTWERWLSARNLPADTRTRVRFEYHAGQALDAAVAGQGVVLGRKVLAGQDLAAGRLVSPFGPELALERSYYLIWKPGRADERRRDALLQWLREEGAAAAASLAA